MLFYSRGLTPLSGCDERLETAVGVIPHRRSANKDITLQSFLRSPLNSPVTRARNRKTPFTDKGGPVGTHADGRVPASE